MSDGILDDRNEGNCAYGDAHAIASSRDPKIASHVYGAAMTGSKSAASGPRARRGPTLSPGRRGGSAAALLLALTLGAGAAEAATYTWDGSTSSSWTTSSNWTPSRTTPATNDELIFNGTTTPTANVTAVPTQTLSRIRFINNVNATFTATAARTLSLAGGTGPQLEVAAGSQLTLSGASAIQISLTSGTSGSISGTITLQGGAHQILGATAGQIVFNSGGGLTTGTGYSSSAFGTTGTANVATFTSGSTYTHNAGSNPFGLTAPSSKVVFQDGSTAIIRSATNFSASGRTYAHLRIQNNAAINSSGSASFQCQSLIIDAGSSFAHSATSPGTITVRGDITTAGTGAVSLTAPSGINFNGGVLQTVGGGGGTGTITLNDDATIASGTTVALARTVTFGSGDNFVVNGTFQLNQGGAVTGGSNFVYGASGKLAFNNTSGSYSVSGTQTFWPSSSGPTNVSVLGAGGITMNTARTVSGLFEAAAAVTSANQLTLSGTVQRKTGGSFSAAPTYSGTPTLVYSTATAGAAIQFDAATTQTGAAATSLTWSHTVANNTNRMLVVGVQAENGSNVHPSSVTFNGTPLTLVNSTSAGTSTFQSASLWYLVAPAAATANVVVTWPSSVGNATAGAISLFNVAQQGPEASAVGTSETGAATTNITTLTDGAWVVDVFGTGQDLGNLAAGSGQTQRYINASGATTSGGGSTKLVSPAGATSMTWTQTGINRSAQVAAAFAPAAGSGGTNMDVGPEWSAGTSVGVGVPWSVTIQAGTATVTMPSSNRALPGNLLISSGTFALHATSGDLSVGGDWTNNGSFTANGRTVTFNGAGNTQTLSRSGGETFSALALDKSSGSVVLSASPATPLTVSGASGDVLHIANGASLNLGANNLTLSGNGGNLRVSGTGSGSQTITGTGTVAFAGTKTVTASAGRTLVFDTSIRVLANAAVNFGSGLTTVRGILELGAGGSVATNPPTYQSGATLRYHTGGAVARSVEWSGTSGAGYPHHVEIASGTLDLGAGGTGTARQLGGNLTIALGATLTLNGAGNAMTASLTALGNVAVAGTLTLSSAAGGDLALGGNLGITGTFNVNQRVVTFQNGATQTVSRSGGLTLAQVRLNKSAGSVQLLSALTCAPPAGDALQFNGTADVLDLNGQTLTLSSSFGGTSPNGSFRGSATSNLILNGTSIATLRFVAGGQSLGNLSFAAGGPATVTLASPLTVNGTLTLQATSIVNGTNLLALGPAASLTRTTGYVQGQLRKRVATGAPSLTFEIGSGLGYTPVALNFASVTTAGDLTASTTDGDHPNISTAGLLETSSVNRWYTVTNGGVAFTTCQATFDFLPGDIDGGANPAIFEVRKRDGGIWSAPVTGLATATQARADGITSFSDFAIGEPRRYYITATSDTLGTLDPAGTVEVVGGSDVTFTLIPANPGIEPADILVDGVPQGAAPSYTFHDVNADHTIHATFKVKRYTLTIEIQGMGTVARDPDLPDYPHNESVLLTATPAEGWEFQDWVGDVSSTENPWYLANYDNYVITARFVRRPAGYIRTAFTGTYSPISTTTGATRLLGAGDDSTRSIPVPFPFVYAGLPYGPSSHLAISANGFMYLSRTSVTNAIATQSNNTNLFVSVFPNATIAPWYDNLSLNAVGTNPSGQILYQVQGDPGNRSLTVQWTNVSSFGNLTGGQPRSINFQAILYEGTNQIEFRYGPISGSSASTQESASIGVEDSLGGNNNYIDGVTGSRTTNHGMMTTDRWPVRFLRFTHGRPTPLEAGTYEVGNGRTYPSLAEAVADLNHRGVAGPVTMRVMDAYQDSSVTGGAISFPLLFSKIEGTSSVNTVTVEPAGPLLTLISVGNDAGFCGNQTVLTAIGLNNEPIVGLVGTDHLVLRKLSLVGGTPVDRGLLVLQSSSSDGSQNNTIEGLAVNLDRTNASTLGIQQSVVSTPIDAGGTNSGNRYFDLNVFDVYAGMSLAGNASVYDVGCEIGTTPGGTSVIGGSTPNDIGNGPVQTFGIRATNQRDVKIHDVEIRNVTGTSGSVVDGLLLENSGSSSASSGTCEIYNNRIHDIRNTAVNAGVVTGMRLSLSSHPSSVARVYNNFIYALDSGSTSTISRRIIGLWAQDGGGGSGATHQIDHNSVRMSPSNVTPPNTCIELGTATGPVMMIRNNVFGNFVGTQSGSGKHYCVVTPSASEVGAPGSISDHNVLHISNAANGFIGLSGNNDRPTLTAWQTATNGDFNSSSSNPGFIAESDLHIRTTQPTPVESRGSDYGGEIPWTQLDIDGNPRHPSAPDIGADEGDFIVLQLNDVAPSAVVDPSEGASKFVNSAFTPRASFENAGTFDQVNVTVRFRIRGPLPATTPVYDQAMVIDSLYSGTGKTVDFPGAMIVTPGMYQAEAETELPTDQNHANDLLAVTFEAAGPLAGSYLVGTGQPVPFNTLTGTIARLNSVGVSAPVTLLLKDPLYALGETFPITIQSYAGSGPGSVVTIRPAPGIVTSINGSSSRGMIVLDGADHVVIDGSNTVGGTTRDLTLVNNHSSSGSAVVWGQTSLTNDPVTYSSLRNLVLAGSGGTGTLVGAGFGGATIGLGSSGNGNHGNTVENCSIMRTQVGIYSSGASAASKNTGTVITGNQMDSASPDNLGVGGILLRYENAPQVLQNRIGNISNSGTSSVYGIALGLTTISSSTFSGQEVTNATVARNQIRGIVSTSLDGVSAAGITVAQAASGATTVVNNMISGVLSPATDPDLTVGILIGGGSASTAVYYNSVSMSGHRDNATAPSFALAIGGSDPTVDVRNNLLINTQTSVDGVGEGFAIGLNYAAPFTRLTSNFNDLVGALPESPLAVIGGLLNSPLGDLADLAAWRTATGRDGNSISADPLFVSASDLHITASGSPAANIGTPIAGITSDFDGDAGNRTTTPDLGADEFGTFVLNVTVVGNGTVSKNPDSPNYIGGTVVQLTATPNPGYRFVSWSGAVTGTTNPVNVTMNSDKNVTATFAINTYTLGVNVTGNGGVARIPNQASYNHGTVVTLTATPLAGSHFVGWSGALTGSDNPVQITMDANKTVTASFALDTFVVDVTVVGNGSVARSPDQTSYEFGSNVTLTATPGPGHRFVGWSGSAGGTTNPLTLTVEEPLSITATFEPNAYTLSLQTVGSGIAVKNPDQALYPLGTQVDVTAIPDGGWHFVGWSGDTASTDNPLTVAMTADRSLTATFEIDRYTLEVLRVGGGTVARSPDQPDYPSGTDVTLTANPSPGYSFLRWEGDATGTDNPVVVNLDANRVVTAVFTLHLNLASIGHGSVALSPDLPNYVPGDTVQITATPEGGHAFVGWTGDTTGTENPITVTLWNDRTITALFTTNLGVSVVGGGSVGRSPDLTLYPAMSTVDLTANPDVGFSFVGWSGDVTSSTNPLSLLMDGDKNVTATFATNTYVLSLSAVGSGTVTPSPNLANYPHGSTVTLTAAPEVGYHFAGWSGDTSGVVNPLDVVMDAPKTITANFAINTYTLSVPVVGDGTVSKVPDQPAYDHGTVVQLTANPGPGYHFLSWSGDATGSLNPLPVSMTADKTITATFEINTYPLSLAVLGSGSLTRNPDQASYPHGAVVEVSATPDAEHSFVNWSGDASGSTNPVQVTMDGPKSVTGIFTSALTVSVNGNGTVGKNPDLVAYAPGQSVQLTANPAVGHHLFAWSGDASGSTNPLDLIMDDDKSVTATFAINSYTLAVSTSGNGSVNKSPDQPTYDHGTPVTLTASAPAGYHFVGWSGSVTDTTNPLMLTMEANHALTATFAINTYSLAVTVVGSGTVDRSPDQPAYNHGSSVLLTATPAQGYSFAGWSGDATGTGNPVSVSMTANRSVTATFQVDTHSLTVNVAGSGTVTKTPDLPLYDYGTDVTLTAIPTLGHHFVGWSGDAAGSTNPIDLNVDGDKTVTATFAINAYTLDVVPIGNGSVSRSPDQAVYDHGTVVQVTAVPAEGYHFVAWGGEASGTDNPLVVVMDDNKDFTATFAINQYAFDLTAAGNGTVSKTPDQALYDHGVTVLIDAVPSPFHHFVGWTGSINSPLLPLEIVMDGPKSIVGTFAIDTYTLAVNVAGNGSVNRSPDQPTYDHGTAVTLTAVVPIGHHFLGWSGTVTDTTNPLMLTMEADHTLTATFAINTYTLAVTTVGNGTVDRSPDLPLYDHGTAVTLTANAPVGYHLVGWSGSVTDTTNPLLLTMEGNHAITATFAINQYALDLTAVGNGTVSKTPDQALYDHGTLVTIDGTPNQPFHHFAGWSGDDSSTVRPLEIVMDGPKTIVGTFAIDTYPLTTNAVGGGSVVRIPQRTDYGHGSEVSLFAIPSPGYHFVSWSGDVIGTTTPAQLTMDGPKTVTATFAIDQYALNVSAIGEGSVTRTPDQPVYDYGTVVQLTAVPGPGSHLRDWIGDASGTANPINVTVDRNLDVTARFWPNTFTLDVSTVGQGTIVKVPDQASYDPGTQVTLTCTPQSGFQMSHWVVSGDTIPFNPLNVTMDSSLVVTAVMVPGSDPAVTVNVVGSGSVIRDIDQPSYTPGTWLTLTPVPGPDYRFDRWVVHLATDVPATLDPLYVFVDRDLSLDAIFVPTGLPLATPIVAGSGGVQRNPDQTYYPISSTVELTAVPSPGFHFLGWTGDTLGSANPITITMDRERTVGASFGFVAGVSATAGGGVTRNPSAAVHLPGSILTLTAVPQPGYHFVGWSGDGSGASPILSLTMDADKTVTATFALDVHAVEVLVVGSGSVTRTPDQDFFAHGSTVTLQATAQPGWHFVRWENCPVDEEMTPGSAPGTGCLTRLENPVLFTVTGSRLIIARFEADGPGLQVQVVGSGGVTEVGGSPGAGTPLRIAAVPEPGWHFAGWSGDVTGVENPLELERGRELLIVATFVEVIDPVAERRNEQARQTVADSAAAAAAPAPIAPAAIADFALAPPFPNPTGSMARMEFAVPRETRVQVSVHDLQGREIARLLDEVRAPGRYSLTWDGRTSRGPAAAGVYFVRMHAGGRDLVRRLSVSR